MSRYDRVVLFTSAQNIVGGVVADTEHLAYFAQIDTIRHALSYVLR